MLMYLDTATINKMTEIEARYPEEYWENKDLDLLRLAKEELKIEREEQELKNQQK